MVDENPERPVPSQRAEGAPSDNTTLVAVLHHFMTEGWNQNMTVTDDGDVRCPSCRTESAPGDVSMGEIRRMEGASDPADMLAVVGLMCPRCDAKGAAVVHYGPQSTVGEVVFLRAIEDERS